MERFSTGVIFSLDIFPPGLIIYFFYEHNLPPIPLGIKQIIESRGNAYQNLPEKSASGCERGAVTFDLTETKRGDFFEGPLPP
jgi:hypothetical protein